MSDPSQTSPLSPCVNAKTYMVTYEYSQFFRPPFQSSYHFHYPISKFSIFTTSHDSQRICILWNLNSFPRIFILHMRRAHFLFIFLFSAPASRQMIYSLGSFEVSFLRCFTPIFLF